MTITIAHLAAIFKRNQQLKHAPSFNLPNLPQVLLDGPTGDPITNIKLLKVNQPIQLLGITKQPANKIAHTSQKYYANGTGIYPLGTITITNDQALKQLQAAFLVEDQLANENQLFVGPGSKLIIADSQLPQKITLTAHCQLEIAPNCHVQNIKLTNSASVHLSANSIMTNASLSNVTTGEYHFNQETHHYFFAIKPVKLVLTAKNGINYLNTVNLEAQNILQDVNFNYAALTQVSAQNALIGQMQEHPSKPEHTWLVNSVLTNAALIKKTDTGQSPTITKITNSKLNDTAYYLTAGKQLLTTAHLTNVIIKQTSRKSDSIIDHTILTNFVTDNALNLTQSKIIAPKTKPLVTRQKLHLTKKQITTKTGGLLTVLNKEIAIKPKTAAVLKPLTMINQQKLLVSNVPNLAFSDYVKTLPLKYNYEQKAQITKLLKQVIANE